MNSEPISRDSQLRLRAELAVRERLSQLPQNSDAIATDELRRTSHELSVYEIELQMQNDELRLAQVALLAERARYFDLYDLAPVGYCTVDMSGLILQANLKAAEILGLDRRKLLNQTLTRHILQSDQDVYYLWRQRLLKTGDPQPCELQMLTPDRTPIVVELAATVAADAGGASLLRMVLIDITQRKSTEESLKQSEQQLRALSRRVLEVQEAERRLVAIELHDELGQSLTAIKINLQSSARFHDRVPGEQNTEDILIVEEALRQVRRLALALRPAMLDDLGLVPALRWMAKQQSERVGFVANVHTVRLQGRLAPDIEIACFRIAQEALTNIARYARATTVNITLSEVGSDLVLSVQDDGSGFDIDATRVNAMAGGSIGVLGMQERAMLIGGTLEIESNRGCGSTVRLRCPMRLREVST